MTLIGTRGETGRDGLRHWVSKGGRSMTRDTCSENVTAEISDCGAIVICDYFGLGSKMLQPRRC